MKDILKNIYYTTCLLVYLCDLKNDILVEFDGRELTAEQFNYIAQLPEILANDEELEVGEFNLGIFRIVINKIKTYEEELIKCER